MKAKQRLSEVFVALLLTFPVPILFGNGVARLFGIWIGVGAGIFASALSVMSMIVLWHICRRWKGTANSTTTVLVRLQYRQFLAEMLMLGFCIFAFGWTGAALVLILGDPEMRRDVFRIFSYLWVWLALVPLCGFSVCWCWRSLLKRKIEKMDLRETKDAT